MKSNTLQLAQLFLRIALSVSFLSAVADRFGFWGNPGSPNVVWGNWQNFLDYSNQVNSFIPAALAEPLAIAATILEIVLPVFLLFGYKTKMAAWISGCLLSGFGLAMTISFGVKSPLDYSVFTAAAAAFVLAGIDRYAYSLDERLP
ncbi:DoxX family membrane protein [Flavobacterium sp.]|uniref:DoxX family membrane protein n=1 Tax=Flavobacterium sp. TaxID=239 RepID=UPI0039E57DAF